MVRAEISKGLRKGSEAGRKPEEHNVTSAV